MYQIRGERSSERKANMPGSFREQLQSWHLFQVSCFPLWVSVNTLHNLILGSFTPSLKAALNTKVSVSFTRSLSLGYFHGIAPNWEYSFISLLLRIHLAGDGEKGHSTELKHVSCNEDSGQDDIMWLAGWEWVQPRKTRLQTIVEALGQSTSHFLTFWAGSRFVLAEVGEWLGFPLGHLFGHHRYSSNWENLEAQDEESISS